MGIGISIVLCIIIGILVIWLIYRQVRDSKTRIGRRIRKYLHGRWQIQVDRLEQNIDELYHILGSKSPYDEDYEAYQITYDRCCKLLEYLKKKEPHI